MRKWQIFSDILCSVQFGEIKGGKAEIDDDVLKEIRKLVNEKLNESGK